MTYSLRWIAVVVGASAALLAGCGAVREQPVTPSPTAAATSPVVATPTVAPTPWPASMIPPGEIVFECGGICISRSDGSDVRRVVESGFSPVWSPDGARIAYQRNNDQRERELVVLDMASADEQVVFTSAILRGPDLYPAWSHDGSAIAVRAERVGAESTDVVVVAADGSWSRSFTGDYEGSGQGLPSWSPDSLKVAFTSERGRERGGGADLFILDLKSGTATELTDDTGYPHGVVWLPGDRLAFADGQLRLFSLQTRSTRQLTHSGWHGPTPGIGVARLAVSPDGACIATLHYTNPAGSGDLSVQVHCLDREDQVQTADVGLGWAARWTDQSRFLLTYVPAQAHLDREDVWMVDLATGAAAPFPMAFNRPEGWLGDPFPSWRPRP